MSVITPSTTSINSYDGDVILLPDITKVASNFSCNINLPQSQNINIILRPLGSQQINGLTGDFIRSFLNNNLILKIGVSNQSWQILANPPSSGDLTAHYLIASSDSSLPNAQVVDSSHPLPTGQGGTGTTVSPLPTSEGGTGNTLGVSTITAGNLKSPVPGAIASSNGLIQPHPKDKSHLSGNTVVLSIANQHAGQQFTDSVVDSHGNIWSCVNYSSAASQIAKTTPAGVTTFINTNTNTGVIQSICLGPDGFIYAASSQFLHKVNTSNSTVTDITINHGLYGICSGPDGNIWATSVTDGFLCRFTTAGVETDFACTGGASASPRFPIAGLDGNIWVAYAGTAKVARWTTSGVETLCTGLTGTVIRGLANSPDGYIVACYHDTNKLGFIDPITLTEAKTISLSLSPNRVSVGPDLNLWVTYQTSATVARVSLSGIETDFAMGTNNTPWNIIPGPEGNMYYPTNGSTNNLQYITLTKNNGDLLLHTLTSDAGNDPAVTPLLFQVPVSQSAPIFDFKNANGVFLRLDADGTFHVYQGQGIQANLVNTSNFQIGGQTVTIPFATGIGGTGTTLFSHGTATFSGAGSVDISDATTTANTIVIVTVQNGTALAEEFSYSVTAGNKYTIHSTNAASTATVGYIRIG